MCGDLPDVSNDAKSRELEIPRCGCCSTAAAWSPVSKEPAHLPAVVRFSFASSGARLILWVRPTFRAQVAFLTTVSTNNFLVGIWIQTLVFGASFLPFFLNSKSRCNVSEGKVSQLGQEDHARDAEGRSAGLLLALNIPPCPKKQGKSQRQDQCHRSWSKHASRWSRSQLPCNPMTNHEFDALSSNVVN